jgi:hypothetical protein
MLRKIKAARDRRPGGLADVVPTQLDSREVGSLPPRRVGIFRRIRYQQAYKSVAEKIYTIAAEQYNSVAA